MISMETTGLAAERREKMREFLRTRGVARVAELGDALGVSPATVRRDLDELEARGRIRRVHGGAMSVEGRLDEPVFDDKASIAAVEKQRIAEVALRYVEPGSSVFLDGGSTVLCLARLLADREDVTVVTNSLRVAGTLSHAGPRLILVGGELRRLSQTFVGSLTQPMMERLRVDTAFMGTIGLSDDEGMTTTDPREAFTKELVIAHASKIVLLAHSDKIGTVSFVRFGSLSDVDVFVTDAGASPRALSAFRKQGMDVVRARVLGKKKAGRKTDAELPE